MGQFYNICWSLESDTPLKCQVNFDYILIYKPSTFMYGQKLIYLTVEKSNQYVLNPDLQKKTFPTCFYIMVWHTNSNMPNVKAAVCAIHALFYLLIRYSLYLLCFVFEQRCTTPKHVTPPFVCYNEEH